eukprot:SAG31_NODE_240_length_19407_cov_29.686140_9_plen_150_part_00
MKPAWDQLGDEFKDSSSVVVGDVDCTVETDLCSDYDVSVRSAALIICYKTALIICYKTALIILLFQVAAPPIILFSCAQRWTQESNIISQLSKWLHPPVGSVVLPRALAAQVPHSLGPHVRRATRRSSTSPLRLTRRVMRTTAGETSTR